MPLNSPFPGLRPPARGGEPVAFPFDLRCWCGARLAGQRQATHQVVACEKCGERRFILPISPLPDPPSESKSLPPSTSRRPLWLGVASAIAIVAIVIVTVIVLATREPPNSGQPRAEEPASEARLQELLADGRSALNDGAYPRAARNFESALRMHDRLAGRPAAERRHIAQLHRQAALLADLLSESPAEILRHSIGLPETDWQELFAQRYAGRSLLLDDAISRNAAGQYQHGFRIIVLGREATIDLAQLQILRDLPLLQPQRMLLGLRLAGVRRESTLGWTLLPDPASGVLFTDADTLAGLSIAPDAELREVLKRQQGWLGE